MHEKTAELIIDDSERESDLLWASGFLAVDQFTWLRDSRGSAIMLTDLELGRGEKESRVDEVISLSAVEKSAREVKGGEPCSFEEIVLQLLKSRNIERVEVPSRFPLMIADFLRSGGIEVVARENPFFSDRRIKRADEIRCLEESQAATEEAMALAIRLISNSEPGPDGVLQLDGEPLTSELIKYSVRSFLLSKGLQIGEFIIAPGDQGCDPHDVVHAAVLEAQETAISLIKPGACGQEIHRRVQQVFESAGFSTQQRDGTWEGFFHGTGHGLGLDIHEPPRISPVGPQLEEGMVVTVEPGLYYPGIGGCRIEDVVLVTADGCRNFNKAPKGLEV